MKIFVTVKPGSKEEKVEKIDESRFRVSVKEPPREGRANAAVVRAIADYFNLPQSRVTIVSGRAFKNKVVEVA